MVGLDRASIWVTVDSPIELIDIGVRKKYRHILVPKTLGETQGYSIGKGNINEIKIIGRSDKRSTIKIDFSYPRSNSESNLYPLTSDIEKIIVDENILNLVKEISLDEEVKIEDLHYDYFELALQEEIGSFYKFNNLLILFYKALSRKYETKESTVYSNYKGTLDRFYHTGFNFKITQGWQLKLYSKAHEHNKKHKKKKLGAIIKLEHRLSQRIIKTICGTTSVSTLTIQEITNSIKEKIGEKLLTLLIEELRRNDEFLERKFEAFNPRELVSLVRDYEEWIFDTKIINSIITKKSKRSKRQIERYRATIRIALIESQSRSSPWRENIGNIKRLELFINKLLLIKCKVKCNYKKHLAFNYIKSSHNNGGF